MAPVSSQNFAQNMEGGYSGSKEDQSIKNSKIYHR